MAIIDQLVAVLGYKIEGEGNLRRFESSMGELEKRAVATGKAIAATAALAGAAVAAGFGLLGKSVIDTSAQFEKFETSLTTIEGSADKAKKSMAWIADFAKTTPYEVAETTEAFIKLKSYGLDPMNGTLTALGDTASGMGKTLNQAVEAYADAVTGEMERLKEFGIKAKDNKKTWIMTWQEGGKEITKEVAKTGEAIGNFLTETWGKKFGGGMLRQSKTWSGMMSNLSDSWSDFMRRIGNAGFFDNVKRRLASLLDMIGGWIADGTIDKVAKALSNFFTMISDVGSVVMERIGTHVAYLNKHWAEAGPIIQALMAILAVFLVAWAPITAAIIAAAAALDDFLTWKQGGDSVIGKVLDYFKQLYDAFMNLTWEQVGYGIADGILKGMHAVRDSIIGFFVDMADAVSSSGGWIQMGEKIIHGIVKGFEAARDFMLGFFTRVFEDIYRDLPAWAKAVVDYISGLGGGGSSGGAGASGDISGGSGSSGQAGGAGGDSLGINARARRYRDKTEYGGQGRVPLGSDQAKELSSAIKKTAADVGASPEDLATLMSFETGGTFNKDIMGGAGGRYRGLIQFGPAEQKKYGITPGMSITEQVDAAGRFLKDRGYKPGMSGEQLYATVNAGNPYKTNASDAGNGGTWGTVSDKWRYQMSGHRANARKLLKEEHGAGPGPSIIEQNQAAVSTTRPVGASVNSNQTVSVNAPITVNVKSVDEANKVTNQGVHDAAKRGTKPARMQTSPAS